MKRKEKNTLHRKEEKKWVKIYMEGGKHKHTHMIEFLILEYGL